jgi:hypothetical protein
MPVSRTSASHCSEVRFPPLSDIGEVRLPHVAPAALSAQTAAHPAGAFIPTPAERDRARCRNSHRTGTIGTQLAAERNP